MVRQGIRTDEILEYFQNVKFPSIKNKENGDLQSLIIFDGYGLRNNDRFLPPLQILHELLKNENIEELTLITYKKNSYSPNNEHLDTDVLLNDINRYLSSTNLKKITIMIDKNFHDRFWIINKKHAFIVGASINSWAKCQTNHYINNKHFFIQDDCMSQNDTDCLMDIFDELECPTYIFEKNNGTFSI